jgi:acyl-CoA synthetase (AMP-forming)/AMP-acid ligase II
MESRSVLPDNYVSRALEVFADYGGQEAISCGDRSISYAEAREAVLSFAAALRDQGVRPGMTIIGMTGNHPESVFLQLALHLLGCRTGFALPYTAVRVQREFVEDADADMLIHDGDLGTELIKELASSRPLLPVLSLGPGGTRPDLLTSLPANAPGLTPGRGPGSIGAEPQSMFYTSGTTGRPKIVLHGHRFYQALLAGGQYYRATGEPPMRHLGITPFYLPSGHMPGLLALFQGGSVVLMDGFDMVAILAAIEGQRITSTYLAPVRLREMLEHPLLAKTDVSSLRYLNCGGSAAAPALLAQAIGRLGAVVRLTYGTTEAPLIADLPFLSLDPAHPERLRSCGTPFADMRIQIRDEAGAELPAGQTGTVWVCGSLVMDGYVAQPELMAQTLVDGWLNTGDIGYLDVDGFLYLVDRAKDIVIMRKGSLTVYPQIIENALRSHPAVRDAAVVGVPEEEEGEAVHAFVVTSPGATVTADELCAVVASELNEVYRPRRIHFVAALPLMPADKVDKKALRARFHAQPSA